MKRPSPISIVTLLGTLVLALAAAGCGGEDDQKAAKFEIHVSADKFAGPAPLSTNFSAKASNAGGDVLYRWRFDDGTSSTDQDPSHTFAQAGYYGVVLDVRDAKGNTGRHSLVVGAWPPKQWAKAQTTSQTEQSVLRVQKVQQARTDKRRAALRVKIRAAAAQKAGGPGQL